MTNDTRNATDEHPFSRTPVLITTIIAAVVLIGGIVATVAVIPDAGPRVTSILTIALPTSALGLVTAIISLRNGRIVQSAQRQITDVAASVETVKAHTNGINSKLLNAVLSSNPSLNTGEIQVIASKIQEAVDSTGGQEAK